MKEILWKENFLEAVFNTIPLSVFVLDHDLRIHSINQAAKNLLGWHTDNLPSDKLGTALKCINARDSINGCGSGGNCENCIIKSCALAALDGKIINHTKGKLQASYGEINILISAAYFEYAGKELVAVIIEDVSIVTELQGLIPICASCKNIRDDKGQWKRLENYIEEHSEVEFTHDICPDCTLKIYGTQKKIG